MTALAASLFTLAALGSLALVISSWRTYGAEVLALPDRMSDVDGQLTVSWAVSERVAFDARVVPFRRPLRAARSGLPLQPGPRPARAVAA